MHGYEYCLGNIIELRLLINLEGALSGGGGGGQ